MHIRTQLNLAPGIIKNAEMRTLGKLWSSIVAGKWRRFIFLFFLLNLVVITRVVFESMTEEVVEPTSHPIVEEPKEEKEKEEILPPTPEATTRPPRANKLLNHMGKNQKKIRVKIMKIFDNLDPNELQEAWRTIDSLNKSQSLQQVKIELALQALKVHLLKDLRDKSFDKVLDPVKNDARPISSHVSPKPMQELLEAAKKSLELANKVQPKLLQLVIATTWRSGSTFLEELLAAHPAVYDHYEPLYQFGLHRVRDGEEALTALKIVRDLLSCKYDDQKRYMKIITQRKKEMIRRNTLLWKFCKTDYWSYALCFNEVFLNQACKLFPWSNMKLVRLRLRVLESVLADESLNAAIVYLVRDPRGVISSRMRTVAWCSSPDCIDPARLCTDMDDDLTAALDFRKQFPGRVFIIRYEDLALDPANKIIELLDFFNLDFDPKMQAYLHSHTTKNFNKPWSTSRHSTTRVTAWTTKLSKSNLKFVQESCGNIMQRFGYLPVNSTENMSVNKILEPLKLPHD